MSNQTYEQLETRIKGMICDECGQVPTVARRSNGSFFDAWHAIRCKCGYDGARLKRRPHRVAEREAQARADNAKRWTEAEKEQLAEITRSLYE